MNALALIQSVNSTNHQYIEKSHMDLSETPQMSSSFFLFKNIFYIYIYFYIFVFFPDNQ